MNCPNFRRWMYNFSIDQEKVFVRVYCYLYKTLKPLILEICLFYRLLNATETVVGVGDRDTQMHGNCNNSYINITTVDNSSFSNY